MVYTVFLFDLFLDAYEDVGLFMNKALTSKEAGQSLFLADSSSTQLSTRSDLY